MAYNVDLRKKAIFLVERGKLNEEVAELLEKAKKKASTLQKFFADQGYTGNLKNQCLLKTG